MALHAPIARAEPAEEELASVRRAAWASPPAERALAFTLGALSLGIVYAITRVERWPLSVQALLLASLAFVRKDRLQIPWLRFFRLATPLLGVLYLGYSFMPTTWWKIAAYEAAHIPHLFNWDALMRAIPLNDAAWLFRHQIEPFSSYFRWVYLWSFGLMVWLPVLRSFFARDIRKMARYALSGHLLQFPLIVPFYFTIQLNEVWFVLGLPDLLERGLSAEMAPIVAQNCFPSMHTSIAFAMMLLAFKEKSRWFRYGMVIYTGSVIFSTMYMGIHWIVDVFAGLLLGWFATWLGERIVRKIFDKQPPKVKAEPVAA